jgi:hypothetical protein
MPYDPSLLADALYIAAGPDPYALIKQGVAAAAKLSGTSKPREQKEVPDSVDVFGWCTWDAFCESDHHIFLYFIFFCFFIFSSYGFPGFISSLLVYYFLEEKNLE